MTDDDVVDAILGALDASASKTQARAVLAALKAAGWQKIGPDKVVVPRKPTEKMKDAGVDASYHQSVSRIYHAMIAAKDE